MKRFLPCLALAGLLSACASLEPEPRVPATIAAIPPGYSEPDAAGAYRPLRWWRGFEDPVLNGLVEEALLANLQIAEAAARLAEARAVYRAAAGNRLPGIIGSADASYTDSPISGSGFDFALGGGNGAPSGDVPETPDRFANERYGLSVAASYEIDFWGRLRNEERAALLDAAAVAADLRTARLTVIAETVSTYFEVVDLRARIALALETIDILADRTARTERRYDRGLASSFELLQVRQDFRNEQAGLPVLEAQLAAAEGRLAVLLGRYRPGSIPALRGELRPVLAFEPIPAGLPIELLGQRPDVVAAWRRLESERFRIGARRAELYPSLTLNASVGTQSDSPLGAFNIMENWVLNLGAGLTAPLFQGGRIRANIDAAEARYAQRAAAYGQAVLEAYRDVSAALEEYEEQRQRYLFLISQREEAQASARLQADRYRSGLSTYVDYLDALRTLNQVRTALSTVGREVALARLNVHRALGGDWSGVDEVPEIELVPVGGERVDGAAEEG